MNVLDASRYIINYSNEKDYGVSNLKLQKLLYFVQVVYVCFTEEKKPCFSETIEAWDFGPVVPEAYREFKQYGAGDIPYIESYIVFPSGNIWSAKTVPYNEDDVLAQDRNIIAEVVDEFSLFSATDLVSITHRQKPWRDAYVPGKSNPIKIEALKEYFHE